MEGKAINNDNIYFRMGSEDVAGTIHQLFRYCTI